MTLKRSKYLSLLIIFTLLLNLFSNIIYLQPAIAAPGGNSFVSPVPWSGTSPTMRFAVGFMSYEIWTNSSGVWTTKSPGESVSIDAPYTFSFPGRTVNDVHIRKFVPGNDDALFKASRNGEKYDEYYETVGTEISNPIVKSGIITGKGTSTIALTANMNGILDAQTPWDVINNELNPADFGPLVQAKRYYYPIVFEIELNGQLEVHHFKKDGTPIDSDFTNQSKSLKVGDSLGITPDTNPKYTYDSYKTSKISSPSGGNFTAGLPPSPTYDGSYDTYYLNLYYNDASNNGKAIIKHFDEAGNSLSSIPGLENKEAPLIEGKPFNPVHDTNPSYIYSGYKKSTTATAPSGSILPGEYSIRLMPADMICS